MYLLIFLLIAIILAIPTFGVSLIVFFLVKNWFDKTAARAILNACLTSYHEGRVIDLYHVNRGAITKLFGWFSEGEYSCVNSRKSKGCSYSGFLDHPRLGQIYLTVFYTVRSGTKNRIFVLASSPEQRVNNLKLVMEMEME